MEGLLSGVGNVDLFDPSTNELIVSTKTLIDSGLNFGIESTEARAGQGNILLGKYFHTSTFGLTLTNQIWNLNFLALNSGGAITASADIMRIEQVSVGAGGLVTITQDPVSFTSTSGIIGWYKKASEDDTMYKKIMFTGKTFTELTLVEGTNVCVKYIINSASARQFKVNADYIPSVVHAVMTVGLFKAGTSSETLTSSSKIGNVIVDVPNFQLEGGQTLDLTSSSIASVSLSGTALATFTGASGCSDQGYYATISEDIFGLDEFASVKNIAVADSDINLSVGEAQKLEVYAMYTDGTVPKLLDNSKLTFTSGTEETATVDNGGVVEAKASGTTNINVKVTTKNELDATALITVS